MLRKSITAVVLSLMVVAGFSAAASASTKHHPIKPWTRAQKVVFVTSAESKGYSAEAAQCVVKLADNRKTGIAWADVAKNDSKSTAWGKQHALAVAACLAKHPKASGSSSNTITKTVKVGQPFSAMPDDSTSIEVTVKSVSCGQPFSEAVKQYVAGSSSNPNGTFNELATPPAAGQQFCVVEFNAVNTGNAQEGWNPLEATTLNVGKRQYSSQLGLDDSIASDYNDWVQADPSEGGLGLQCMAFGVNPGLGGPIYGVYEIPAGASPTSIYVDSKPGGGFGQQSPHVKVTVP